jgi:hypothetical protein
MKKEIYEFLDRFEKGDSFVMGSTGFRSWPD